MERKAVESNHLVSVGYDTERLILEIEFKNGSVYQYNDVPQPVYEAMMRAKSVGTYFRASIRDDYPHKIIQLPQGK